MSRRAHVVLPDEVVDAVDRVAGRRKRSVYVEAAIREKLGRDALAASLEASAGMLKVEDYPEWREGDAISAWVTSLRQEDDANVNRDVPLEPT